MNVRRFQVIDIPLSTDETFAGNPFYVHIEGRFVGPSGEVFRVPGYYSGGTTWKVRFSPHCEGTWTYTIRSTTLPDVDGTSGTIECVAAAQDKHGVPRVSSTHPTHFQFDDGTFFFMNAYECDWLWAIDLGAQSLQRTNVLVDQVARHKFNTVLMNVYAHDSGWMPGKTSEYDFGPPALFAWEGTNDEPDHSKLNLAFFDHFDSVIELLESRGIVAHLYLKVYNKKVSWPERLTPEEDLYFRYVVARYQAYWNVIWDFSKESYNEPDKAYLYNRVTYVRALDSYGHMVTTHDDHTYASNRLHRGSIDFYTAQQHVDYYESVISAKSRYGMPYFNSEFGYEHGPEGMDDYTYGVRQSPEELIWRAWEICMAGGYPAYYYTYTAWDVVDFRHQPPGYEYFRILYDFFASLRFWEMEPTLSFCRPRTARVLARGKEEYVVFHHARDRSGGLVTEGVDLEAYDGYWLDIFSGAKVPLTEEHATRRKDGVLWHLRLPSGSKTAVLHLVRR